MRQCLNEFNVVHDCNSVHGFGLLFLVFYDIGLCQLRLSRFNKAEKRFTQALELVQSLRLTEHQDLHISYSNLKHANSLCVIWRIMAAYMGNFPFSQRSHCTGSVAETFKIYMSTFLFSQTSYCTGSVADTLIGGTET